MPLWVRENSIIATEQKDEDQETQLELRVYGLTEEAHAEVYQKEKLLTSVTLRREGNKIHGDVKGSTKVKIRFVGEHGLQTIGADTSMEKRDSILSLPQWHGAFICTKEN